MSALGDLSAALLPPEAGGPAPERVASVARPLIEAMPASSRAAVGAGLLALQGLSSPATGARSAGSDRSGAGAPRPLARLGGRRGRRAQDARAAGRRRRRVRRRDRRDRARRTPPSRPDPPLNLTPAAELAASARCDAIVIGSGRRRRVRRPRARPRRARVVLVEEGERWDSARLRAAAPARPLRRLYRDGGATMALGTPPIALPLGRAVGGTTVVNSGTCYRPPEAVVTRWRDEHGLALAARSGSARGSPTSRRRSASRRRRSRCWAATASSRSRAPRRSAGRRRRCGATPPAAAAPASARSAAPTTPRAGVHLNALPQACEAGARIVTGLRATPVAVERGRARPASRARAAAGATCELRAPRVVVAARRDRDAAAAAPQRPRPPSAARPRPLDPPGARRHRLVRRAGVRLAGGDAERRDRGAPRARGRPARGDLDPARDGRDRRLPGFGDELLDRLARAASTGHPRGDDRRRALGPRARRRAARWSSTGSRRRDRGCARRSRRGAGPARGRRRARSSSAAARPRSLASRARRHGRAARRPPPAPRGLSPDRHRRGGLGPGPPPGRPEGRLRGVDGVWVADASILPSCPGVNPQVSIMAMAAGVGEAASERRLGFVATFP